jgi:hypothetical protein
MTPTPTPAALAESISAFLDRYFPFAGSAALVFDQGDSLPPMSVTVRGGGLPINCGDNDPWPVALSHLPAIGDPKRKPAK